MAFDLFQLYQNQQLPLCVFISEEDPEKFIKLEHGTLKMMGRADADPMDEDVPLLQMVAIADCRAHPLVVRLKVIIEGLSYLNGEEMDPYEKYLLQENDEISFLKDDYKYRLHFVHRNSKEYPFY